MQCDLRVQLFVAVLALPASVLAAYAVSDSPSDRLASVESFSSISDTAARSAAIFTELGKVLTHPRCLNCHPAGDRPRQGDMSRLHQPPVERGADGLGLPALRCPICHQQRQLRPRRHAGQSDLASRPARNGMGRQDARRDLRPDQGSRAQRQPICRCTR